MKDTGGRPTVSDDSLEVRAMALFSECLDIPIEQQQAWLRNVVTTHALPLPERGSAVFFGR